MLKHLKCTLDRLRIKQHLTAAGTPTDAKILSARDSTILRHFEQHLGTCLPTFSELIHLYLYSIHMETEGKSAVSEGRSTNTKIRLKSF